MKSFISFLIALIFVIPVFSQECEVKLVPINGKYTGDCKDGKAHGTGKSVGLDTYEGDFKKGSPDGQGTYTWSIGDFYKGAFVKGVKSGKGEMHFKRSNKADSVVVGFWEKDIYKGMYQFPYSIVELGSDITHKSVQKLGTKTMNVYFSMESGINGTPDVNNFQIMSGFYQRTNKAEMGKTRTIEFQDVQFPFRVKFNSIDRGTVDIHFFEAGEWRVEIVY